MSHCKIVAQSLVQKYGFLKEPVSLNFNLINNVNQY